MNADDFQRKCEEQKSALRQINADLDVIQRNIHAGNTRLEKMIAETEAALRRADEQDSET